MGKGGAAANAMSSNNVLDMAAMFGLPIAKGFGAEEESKSVSRRSSEESSSTRSWTPAVALHFETEEFAANGVRVKLGVVVENDL